MPYLSKIYGATSTTVAKQAVINARSAWVDIGAGSVQIYDGRPKLVEDAGGSHTNATVTIQWLNITKVATNIRIERKTGSGGTWGLLSSTLLITDTEYEDGPLASGTYYYRVMPFNDWGYVSDAAEEVMVYIQPFSLTPSGIGLEVGVLSGATYETSLSSPQSWSRTDIDYGAGPSGWFSTSPVTGGATTDTTITVTINTDITDEWVGSATFTKQDGVSIILGVVVEPTPP